MRASYVYVYIDISGSTRRAPIPTHTHIHTRAYATNTYTRYICDIRDRTRDCANHEHSYKPPNTTHTCNASISTWLVSRMRMCPCVNCMRMRGMGDSAARLSAYVRCTEDSGSIMRARSRDAFSRQVRPFLSCFTPSSCSPSNRLRTVYLPCRSHRHVARNVRTFS